MNTYMIAEIGFNHEGDIKEAVKMIAAAANAGADAVKFQTFKAIDLALPSAAHYDAIKCGEMDLSQHVELARVAKDNGINFLSTPFSPSAVEILEKVAVPAYKIASMDCINKHLLGYIAQTGKPIYLSTGMATLNEIAETLEYLKQSKSGPVTLLHCMSLYPAEADDLNLDMIPFLNQLFEVPTGYSDHFPGTTACLAAAMMGAAIIETHFTLDSSRQEGDHHHSVEPNALKKLISDIGLFQRMKGDRRAVFNRPDRKYAKDYRRGLYFAKDLPKNHNLNEDDFLLCRPTSELSPNDLKWINSKILQQDQPQYQPVEKNMVDPL